MKKFLVLALVSIVLLNCKKFDSDPTPQPQQCIYDSCARKAPATEIQSVQDYLTTNNITAKQHCSGIFYEVVTEGAGVTATACSFVTVKYIGKLTNGTVFDQTQPGATYSNYLNNLIVGWINGIPYVKPGGKIRLYIPPSLGYGSAANGPIPANSVLIFEIDLVAVQ
jgi:FKBP-type peptidyl-prolyl cis-trans isomerase FkpA